MIRRLLAAVLLSAAPAADDVKRLAPLVIDGEARAIVTVVVPLPEEMRARAEVAYVVRLLNGATLVGPRSGILAPAGGTVRSLVLALRVPADVRAGELDVAEVEFRSGELQPIAQPVTLRVPLRRQVSITGMREVNALQAGDHVEFAFRLVNDGNAPEALTVVVSAPEGWHHSPRERKVIVVPRAGSVEVPVQVEVPITAGIGDYTVSIAAHASWPPVSEPLTQSRTVLRVIANRTTLTGVTLTPIVAVASSSDGSAGFAGATLEGPVTEAVMLRARLLPRARQSGIVAQGLSAVGAFAAPFAASLSGDGWEVAAGSALVQLGDLSGVNVFGEGLRANATRGDWEMRAVAGRPMQELGTTGTLIGGGVWRDADFGRIGGSASYLTERGGFARGRELTAFQADYTAPRWRTLSLGGSVGYRSSFGDASAGAAISVAHERPQDRLAVRYTHAPGGTQAFARAAEEFELAAGRTLNERWSLDASFARTHDDNGVFRGLDMRSWSLGQRYAFSSEQSGTLRAQGTDFDARAADSDLGGFGSGSRELAAGWEMRRGLLALSGEFTTGAMLRRSELLSGQRVTSTAAQQGARVSASRALERFGAIDASAGVQFTQAGVGMPGDAWNASARWSGIPLRRGRNPVELDSELQYQRIGDLQSFLVARTQLRVALPGALDLALSAERNPYYRDAAGRAGWIAAMRLSVRTLLRTAGPAGAEGVVFSDHDGNGRRDPGEPGIGGVVLRRGDARVVTDREGRYRMPARARGRVRVDQGSLPLGLLAHPLLAVDTLERLDIPLLLTGTVALELRPTAGEDGRTPTVSLKGARVMLRDATGFEWMGRHRDDSTVVFEDIPAGSYAPRFDFSEVGEPLRVEEGMTVVVAPREQRSLVVPLRGRNVRIIVPPRGQRQSEPRREEPRREEPRREEPRREEPRREEPRRQEPRESPAPRGS